MRKESKGGARGEGGGGRKARGYSRPEIHGVLLFGCNPSTKGEDLAQQGGTPETETEDETRLVEPSEVHVSQYPSRPKLDFRNSRWRATDHAVHVGLLAPVRSNFTRFRRKRGRDRAAKHSRASTPLATFFPCIARGRWVGESLAPRYSLLLREYVSIFVEFVPKSPNRSMFR